MFYPVNYPKIKIRKVLASAYNYLLPINKKWILFVGRLQEVKAPIRLIKVFFEYYKRDKI